MRQKILHRKFTFWTIMLLVGMPLTGQTTEKKIMVPDGSYIAISKLDAHIKKAMDSLNYPGLSIAFINENKVVHSKGYGFSNTITQEPVQTKTIFQGASLSKPLFAYFMLKMVEEGRLDLDEPIYPFLKPVFPEEAIEKDSFEYYQTITPRMVLSHTTGIPNWANGKAISIAFTPGTAFSYSGEAYQHLGAAFSVKEGIDWGKELDSLIKIKVNTPLHMDNSFFVWRENSEGQIALGHIDGKMLENIKKFKKVGPGFSLHTTAEDYAQFLIEMMESQNMSHAMRDAMLKEEVHFDSANELYQQTGQTGWGLGFAQKQTKNGLYHLHTGKNPGFESYAMFIPELNYGFVMFGNSNNIFPLLRSIEELIGEHF